MPALQRTMDATFLNSVANREDVRPFLGGEGEIDLGPLLLNPANVCLVEPDAGGWLLQAVLPGVYELHTAFLPEARGASYFNVAREALRWVFTATDALELWTKCPDDNGGARFAAARMGFRERFRREDAWQPGVGISYQALTVDDWVARDRRVISEGEAFHRRLEEAKVAAGITLPPHPADAAHDRAVGAACLMIKGGQLGKAVGVYGRWARFAGYQPIEAVGNGVLDIGDAIVEVTEDATFRVLRWADHVRSFPADANAEP